MMVVDNDNGDDGRSFFSFSVCELDNVCPVEKYKRQEGERNEIQDGKRVSEEREV